MRVSPTSVRSIAAILAQVGGAIVGGALLAAAGYLGVSLLFMRADLGMALLGLQVYGIVLGFGVGAALARPMPVSEPVDGDRLGRPCSAA